jgi:hypothetical protein
MVIQLNPSQGNFFLLLEILNMLQIIIIVILGLLLVLELFVFFLGRAYYLCTDFVRYKLETSYRNCMLTIYPHTKFQMPRSSGSLVTSIAIKTKAKYRFHAATMLFYIVQKNCLNKNCVFSKICYHTSFQDSVLSGTSVAPTSQICASTMLALSLVGN